VAFLRLTRDRRGYENTFLLHADHPGEEPRVLYWYRTAPGVRVGRPALDEDAIRTIEEQHPHIEFDWPHILEVGAITQPEEEERPVRQKRRGVKDQGSGFRDQAGRREQSGRREQTGRLQEKKIEPVPIVEETIDDEDAIDDEREAEVAPRAHDLLEELVGREIATRLHARYAEIIARVHRIAADHPQRGAWEARAEALNPDNWVTPDEVLSGVQRADALFDSLRHELLAH
jgi:hypothetical protein